MTKRMLTNEQIIRVKVLRDSLIDCDRKVDDARRDLDIDAVQASIAKRDAVARQLAAAVADAQESM